MRACTMDDCCDGFALVAVLYTLLTLFGCCTDIQIVVLDSSHADGASLFSALIQLQSPGRAGRIRSAQCSCHWGAHEESNKMGWRSDDADRHEMMHSSGNSSLQSPLGSWLGVE